MNPDSITAVLAERLASTQVTAADGKPYTLSDFAILPPQAKLLRELVAHLAPAATLEVGCASALSTLAIAAGMQQAGTLAPGCMQVMDPKQTTHWHNIGRDAIAHANIAPWVSFHEACAHEVLPELLKQNLRIQLAFVDGWHLLDYVMLECFYVDKMLDCGGVVVLHDLHLEGLQLFAAFWVANCSFQPVRWVDGALSATAPAAAAADAPKSFYAQAVAPYVQHNMLLLRKTSEDSRGGMDFVPFH